MARAPLVTQTPGEPPAPIQDASTNAAPATDETGDAPPAADTKADQAAGIPADRSVRTVALKIADEDADQVLDALVEAKAHGAPSAAHIDPTTLKAAVLTDQGWLCPEKPAKG